MGNTNQIKKSTMPNFDIQKYVGVWYEIARIPDSDNMSCGESELTYTLIDTIENNIRVLNQCTKIGSQIKFYTARGYAEDPGVPSKMTFIYKDTFPETRIDYWIYETDYVNYSIVGGKDNKKLWILHRKKNITSTDYFKLLDKAYSYGFKYNDIVINDSDSVKPSKATI